MLDNKNDIDLQFIKECMGNNSVLYETKISVNHLEDPLAKILFSVMMKCMVDKNCFIPTIDFKILFDDKDRLSKLNAFNHPIKLTTVENLIIDITNIQTQHKTTALEKSIIERYTRKQMSTISYKLSLDIVDSSKSTYELLRKYSFYLDELMNDTVDTRQVLTSDDVYLNELEFLNSNVENTFPQTGLPIDNVNGGLNAPSLTVICGRPKAGKSIFLYNSAINSLMQGRTVLFVTIEIPVDECFRKMMSIYSGIHYNLINKKKLSDKERDEYLTNVKSFSEKFKDKLFIIDDQKGISSKDIQIYVNTLERAGFKIDDIYVDYIMIMQSNNPKLSQVESLSAIPQELRQLSQSTNTRVFSAQQLHSKSESKTIDELTFDDIYFCKTLAFEATYTLVIDNTRRSDNSSELKVAFLPSRQVWDNIVRIYPNFNQPTLTLNECVEYSQEPVSKSYTDSIIDSMVGELGIKYNKVYDFE